MVVMFGSSDGGFEGSFDSAMRLAIFSWMCFGMRSLDRTFRSGFAPEGRSVTKAVTCGSDYG